MREAPRLRRNAISVTKAQQKVQKKAGWAKGSKGARGRCQERQKTIMHCRTPVAKRQSQARESSKGVIKLTRDEGRSGPGSATGTGLCAEPVGKPQRHTGGEKGHLQVLAGKKKWLGGRIKVRKIWMIWTDHA